MKIKIPKNFMLGTLADQRNSRYRGWTEKLG